MDGPSRILLRFAIVLMVFHILPVCAHELVTSKLFEDLFDNSSSPYKPELLPVCVKENNVVVELDIALRQIISLEEKAQILHTNIWIRLNWPDCRLSWTPSEYDGIENLVVPYDNVWTPDLALYDSSAEEEMMPGRDQFRAQINFTGVVTYNFPTVLTSVCKVKVAYFPFDVQNCSLQFGSWSHSLSDIDIRSKAVEGDLSDYLENNEWEVVRLDAIRIIKSYTFGDYPDVRYFIIIKRRPQFYVMTMLFPCILVSAIAMIGFLLPAESGEKVSLEVTVLLSLAVFLLVISDFLPPSAEQFPIIGTYFAVAMVMVSFSLVLSVLVLNIHHRGENGKEVPAWVRIVFLEKIGQMCVNKSKHKKYSPDDRSRKTHCDSNSVRGTFNTFEMNEDKTHENHVNPGSTMGMHDSCITDVGRLLGDHAGALHGITEHLKDKDRHDKVCEEWRALARIVDRLLLLTYVIISVIVTLVFLLPLNFGEQE